MGLNICKKIISKLGPNENLFISSKVGKGSKFSFLIQNKSFDSSFKPFKLLPSENLTSEKFIRSKINKFSSNCDILEDCSSPKRFFDLKIKLNQSYEINSNKSEVLPSFSSWNSNAVPLDDTFLFNDEFKNPKESPAKKFKKISSAIPYSKISSKKTIFFNRKFLNFLIVDDNMFNLLILTSFLESLSDYKINITKSYNGLVAYETFLNLNKKESVNNIDIIIMDCEMPIMNGYDASNKIREKIIKEKFVDVCIIAYTGMSGEEEEEKCSKNGMDGYLLKPTTKEQFCNYFHDIFNNFYKFK